ncbi:MAG: hypothetical protein JXR49_22260 [Acidobacteria bacterium]|nr:hypothetical protein [Acidobacteriota bacterium]
MVQLITLHFFGPYTLFKGNRSLFHSEHAKSEGIYLWVIKDRKNNLNYIHYIGETTNFSKRQKEHLTQVLGLNYMILDAKSAEEGVLNILWNGMWRDKTADAAENVLENYGEMSRYAIDYIMIIDIYFAPTKLSLDIRRHIEGRIGWNLRKKYPELKLFYPDDNHVGTKPEMLGHKIVISSDEKILGLDEEMEI